MTVGQSRQRCSSEEGADSGGEVDHLAKRGNAQSVAKRADEKQLSGFCKVLEEWIEEVLGDEVEDESQGKHLHENHPHLHSKVGGFGARRGWFEATKNCQGDHGHNVLKHHQSQRNLPVGGLHLPGTLERADHEDGGGQRQAERKIEQGGSCVCGR